MITVCALALCFSATGLPFCSVLGTMNHILAADLLWYSRMTSSSSVGRFQVADVSARWSQPAATWLTLTEGLDDCDNEIQAQCDRWRVLVRGLTPSAWSNPFSYTNTRGEPLENRFGPILTHVFNHGTHHRGQVSTVITGAGLPAPALDLLYMLNSNA
jgi:uncharacterized damage-inducible protein DinB